MEFIHSVLAQNEAVIFSTVVSYDLPVNPLSHILITLKCQQNNPNYATEWGEYRGMIIKIEVLYKGSAIFSMTGCDCLDAAMFLLDFEVWNLNNTGTDNDYRWLTYLVPLGRKLYEPRECFPASTRGELILQITYATSPGSYDNVKAQIETVEMPDAAPERYLRMTTLSVTPSATGEHDVDLPIGNPISDLMLHGTTTPTANADTKSINYVQILVDNMRKYYSHINFETLHSMGGLDGHPPGYHGYHKHILREAAYAQFDRTGTVIPGNHVASGALHLPFDINRDGEFMLETAGKSSVVCRVYAGVADAMRVIPCEIVPAAGGV